MKFNIKDIGERGARVVRTLGPDEVQRLLSQSRVEPAVEDARVDVDLELLRSDESTVLVRGQMSGHFWVTCSRCLGLAQVTVDEPELRLTFLPPRTALPDEVELDLEDV